MRNDKYFKPFSINLGTNHDKAWLLFSKFAFTYKNMSCHDLKINQ